MSSSVVKESARATDVAFNDAEMMVTLSDGRTLTAPLQWFPRLLRASASERNDWRLIGSGIGISWEALDEDVSVAGLLAG